MLARVKHQHRVPIPIKAQGFCSSFYEICLVIPSALKLFFPLVMLCVVLSIFDIHANFKRN